MRTKSKKASIIVIVLMVMFVAIPALAFTIVDYNSIEFLSGQKFIVTVDGNQVDFNEHIGQPVLLKTGRIFVPIRVISENMGYNVDWSRDTWVEGIRKVWVKTNEKEVELTIGSDKAIIDGQEIYIDYDADGNPVTGVRVFVHKDRIYVPLRFIAEAFGAKLEYEKFDDVHYISINTEESTGEKEVNKTIESFLKMGKAKKVPVLLYHHILKEEEMKNYGWENNSSVISMENFKEQMEYLNDNGYYTATLDELNDFLNGTIELPKRTVVITFDDGYLSNHIYAYPIMKEYGFKGTIFMIGEASINPQIPFNPKYLQFISKSEIKNYEDVFKYACHTYSLHKADEKGDPLLLSAEKDEILSDLKKNKELWETSYIAYPHGKYNKDILAYIKELGYTMGFTIKSGYVSKDSDRLQLPRFIVYPSTGLNEFMKIAKGGF